jgi:predicted Zn-dependent protease
VIDRRALTRALATGDLADWVVIERDQELAVVDEDGGVREEHRTRWQVTVHADTPEGRGSTRVEIDASEGDPEQVVREAIARARVSVGPAWATTPQAAPARVELADPAFGNVRTAAVALLRLVPTRPAAKLATGASVLRERVAVQSRQGVHADWLATLARVDALVILDDHGLEISREARRAEALELTGAVDDALADLRLLATATAAVPGPCAIVLAPDALLHGGLGVWNAFVTQADPVVARQGLTRYHERMPIVEGADQLAEPLSVTSNGALPYGVLSAPIGDDGDAVREFQLIEDGVAAGLGLTPREGALRHRDPNGGVRNLVVAVGSWDAAARDPAGPMRVLEVRRLRGLEIDPYTGEADLEIGLAIDRTTGAAFTGGTMRLDLIDALARARRSVRRIRRGPYDGPAAVRIERATLL